MPAFWAFMPLGVKFLQSAEFLCQNGPPKVKNLKNCINWRCGLWCGLWNFFWPFQNIFVVHDYLRSPGFESKWYSQQRSTLLQILSNSVGSFQCISIDWKAKLGSAYSFMLKYYKITVWAKDRSLVWAEKQSLPLCCKYLVIVWVAFNAVV